MESPVAIEPLAPWVVATHEHLFRWDPKKLVDFLARIATAITKKDAGKAIEAVWTLIELSKGDPQPEEIAETLIQNAMTTALVHILENNEAALKSFFELTKQIFEAQEENALHQYPLFLKSDFYYEVYRSEFVQAVGVYLDKWLAHFAVPDERRKAIVQSLPNEFLIALVEEWRRKPDLYNTMRIDENNPFLQAAEREYNWAKYRRTLIEAYYKEPMFEEEFGLAAVYVGLRAYHLVLS